MHFNFHLSGDESPEQSRRIANAVLALGGLTSATFESAQTHVIRTGEISPELRQALKDGGSANVSVGYRVTEGAHTGAGILETHPPIPPGPDVVPPNFDSTAAEIWAELSAPVDNAHVEPEAEQFAGALTSGEIRAAESFPPTPPIPITPEVSNVVATTDHNGLPWDERIHSSSRAINADGTWRYRKNVPDETKRDVEAELRGLVQHVPTQEIVTASGPVEVPLVPITPPLPPTLPAPPVPTGALQRTYSDVVNLIMSRKVQPDTYVAILGMSLPEFAKHVISAPNDATLMFDALDQASRP